MGAMDSGGVMESQPWKGLETSLVPLSHFADGQTEALEGCGNCSNPLTL